jgi:F0F1-type ATP synthase epsilon subunit
MNTFKYEIVTPNKAYPPCEAVSLNVLAEEGPLTVLARHQSMVCCLKTGKAKITTADLHEEIWKMGQGILTVRREMVTLLVDEADILTS